MIHKAPLGRYSLHRPAASHLPRVATRAAHESFRRYKVLQRDEQEFYWGTKQRWGTTGRSFSIEAEPAAASLETPLREASSLHDLLELLKINVTDLSPRQLHTSLLRLVAFTEAGGHPLHDELPALAAHAAATCGRLPPQDLVTLLWAFASLGLAHSPSCLALLSAAATALEPSVDSLDSQDAVSLLWAMGTLSAAAGEGLPTPAQQLASSLCTHLTSDRLRDLSLPEDRADLATGLARLVGWVQPPEQHLVLVLMDRLAGEVQRDLSNKHSGSAAVFTPRQLCAFVGAYADAQCYRGIVPRMLDAISNTVVKAIRARHLHCISRPEDMVALLGAYSHLGHNSVVVPELLRALATQVRDEVACAHEVAARTPTEPRRPLCPSACVADLLQSFIDLSHTPGATMLEALWVDLAADPTPLEPPTAARLLTLTLLCAHHPSPSTLHRLLSRIPPAPVAPLPAPPTHQLRPPQPPNPAASLSNHPHPSPPSHPHPDPTPLNQPPAHPHPSHQPPAPSHLHPPLDDLAAIVQLCALLGHPLPAHILQPLEQHVLSAPPSAALSSQAVARLLQGLGCAGQLRPQLLQAGLQRVAAENTGRLPDQLVDGLVCACWLVDDSGHIGVGSRGSGAAEGVVGLLVEAGFDEGQAVQALQAWPNQLERLLKSSSASPLHLFETSHSLPAALASYGWSSPARRNTQILGHDLPLLISCSTAALSAPNSAPGPQPESRQDVTSSRISRKVNTAMDAPATTSATATATAAATAPAAAAATAPATATTQGPPLPVLLPYEAMLSLQPSSQGTQTTAASNPSTPAAASSPAPQPPEIALLLWTKASCAANSPRRLLGPALLLRALLTSGLATTGMPHLELSLVDWEDAAGEEGRAALLRRALSAAGVLSK